MFKAHPLASLLLSSSLCACASTKESPSSYYPYDAEDSLHADIAQQVGVHTSLFRVKAVMDALLDDATTLDPSLGDAENADRIAARISTMVTDCNFAKVQHTPGEVSVVVDLGLHCVLPGSGMPAAGTVMASVSVADARAAVTIVMTNVNLGYLGMSGVATVATADRKTYTYEANLNVIDLGHVVFNGTYQPTGDGHPGLTLTGAGHFDTSDDHPVSPLSSYECMPSSNAFTLTGVRRHLDACFAEAGKAVTTTVHDCQQPLSTEKAHVITQTTIEWSSNTPQRAEVNAVIAATIDGDSFPGTPQTTAVPWDCLK